MSVSFQLVSKKKLWLSFQFWFLMNVNYKSAVKRCDMLTIVATTRVVSSNVLPVSLRCVSPTRVLLMYVNLFISLSLADWWFRRMAKLLKRGKGQPRHDWANSGSFISRPANGWLHSDDQLLPNAGICYGVRVRLAFSYFFLIPVFDCWWVFWFIFCHGD